MFALIVIYRAEFKVLTLIHFHVSSYLRVHQADFLHFWVHKCPLNCLHCLNGMVAL